MNYIIRMEKGKPVIYSAVGDKKSAPVYIFMDKESHDAAIEAHLIPVGALIVKTYDAVEMAGGPFDPVISPESENAPQNKAVAEALAKKASEEEFGRVKICPVGVVDITEDNGIVLGGSEKNPTKEGSLANGIAKINNALSRSGISGLSNSGDATVNTSKFSGNGVGYIVKNGICFVSLELTPLSELKNNDIVCTGLPSPIPLAYYLSLTAHDTSYSARINSAGELYIYYPSSNKISRIDTTFSYPVNFDT